MEYVFAGLLAILAWVVILLVVLPVWGANGFFVNTPGEKEKSGFHIFTRLEPGQVKIIVRGEKFVRMITNTAGKKFARIREVDSAEHWELVEGNTENPVDGVWAPIRWWAKIVYSLTGLVFTGIYPFQRVREYTLERTKVNRTEVDRTKDPGKSNLVLEVKADISDHYRTREFLFSMHITGAEVKGNIPLDIIGTAELETMNAYKAAYGTDRWDQKVINLVTDAINSKTKTMTLDEILNAKDDAQAMAITIAAKGITEDTEVCGIQVTGFKILEINPILSPADQSAIQAGAIAEQRAKATRIDGSARADALRALNEATVAGGEHSITTMETEALVRAAEAAGRNGGSVILMPPGNNRGQGSDSTSMAILAELKKLNQEK